MRKSRGESTGKHNKHSHITPLTHPDPRRPGESYARLDIVESQIRDCVALDPSILLERATLRDPDAVGYLKSECLVYFTREYHRAGEQDLVNRLITALLGRCAKFINDKVRWLIDSRYHKECFDEAVAAVFEPILDLKSDHGDFSQRLFWVFMTYRTMKVIDRYMKQQKQDLITRSLDTQADETVSSSSPLPDALRVDPDSIFDHAAIQEAIRVLKEPLRTAFLMRHYGEWEIQNKDKTVQTISKYFDVSPRTVARWLAEAEEQLRGRQGD